MSTTLIEDIHNLTQKISIIWSIEDVLSVRPLLSKQQASAVLRHLKNNHDANIGINWDVIEIISDEIFPTEEEYSIK